MKDEQINRRFYSLEKKITELLGLRFGYCPRCEHLTAQKYKTTLINYTEYGIEYKHSDSCTCLTCGAELICESKQICTEVKSEGGDMK